MPTAKNHKPEATRSLLWHDLTAGAVVFFVALPLNMGIALAAGTPPISGLIAGIVGGIVVGSISGSHTSVSGPAAGLTAVIVTQIAVLGSFEAFLLAVVIAGIIQTVLGITRVATIFAFVPSCVIQGLLAAIGILLVLKQFPHVLGHDTDPQGEMSFHQPDQETTFTEIAAVFNGDVQLGAAAIGLLSLALLASWSRFKPLRQSLLPSALVVIVLSVTLHLTFRWIGGPWSIGSSHLVQMPVAENTSQLLSFLTPADFSLFQRPAIYLSALVIATVASLETSLNLEAIDRLDPDRRDSPQSREFIAQGVGNIVTGLIGGLPMTSVIGRSSVNVNAGAKTRLATIFHGLLLFVAVVFLPTYLSMIPLSALAAILLATGFTLASPALFRRMWREGPYQFIPFLTTILAIVFTDLLIGILIGVAVSALFVLNNNARSPVRQVVERHVSGDVQRIELARQVSFLNRTALAKVLNNAPRGSQVLIDASDTHYIDPDVQSLIRDFKEVKGPAHGVTVSLKGFKSTYKLRDDILFVDYSTRELQDQLTARQVLAILREGNQRFRNGNRLERDFGRQIDATAKGQTPLAVVLSCIDSRVPVELVFDLGIGDVFSVRVAGNVLGEHMLGSIEYGVLVSGVKLVLVMGHTRCGAVTASVELLCADQDPELATGCSHLQSIVDAIGNALDRETCPDNQESGNQQELLIGRVTRKNVLQTVAAITEQSAGIRKAVNEGKVMVVGALYDVVSGDVTFLSDVPDSTDSESARLDEPKYD